MKLITFTPLILLAMTSAPTALADFHLVAGNGLAGLQQLAVASNKYNCKGVDGGCKGCNANIVTGDLRDAGTNFFNIRGNLCGARNLDLYRNGDKFLAYNHGGDGSVQAECYHNHGNGINCGLVWFTEEFVCYSYLCKP